MQITITYLLLVKFANKLVDNYCLTNNLDMLRN